VIIGPDIPIKLWQVARASSAAQTYFPAFQWTHPRLGPVSFWDGGTSQDNAPDMLVVTSALTSLHWPLAQMTMLSLGNGDSTWPWKMASTLNPSLKEAAEMTLDSAYRCGEMNSIWQAQCFLGTRHTLIDPPMDGDPEIDNATPANLQAISAAWEQAFADYQRVQTSVTGK
jgi:hypothetical protein